MNKLYDIKINVNNRSRFTPEALRLIENNISDVVITTSTEREFANSIADDIMALNNGKIDGIEIVLTCLEDLPYSTYSYDSRYK